MVIGGLQIDLSGFGCSFFVHTTKHYDDNNLFCEHQQIGWVSAFNGLSGLVYPNIQKIHIKYLSNATPIKSNNVQFLFC